MKGLVPTIRERAVLLQTRYDNAKERFQNDPRGFKIVVAPIEDEMIFISKLLDEVESLLRR